MTLPWYPRDMGKYARDTKQLTMLEHGAYNLMLDYYYSTGGLPRAIKQCSSNASLMPDHSRIYRVCGAASKQEQEAVDNVLELHFTLDEQGYYRNEKADQVIQEQEKKHEMRVRIGRENREKAMLKQCSSNARQTQTKTKNNTPKPPQGAAASRRVLPSVSGEGGFNVEHHLTDDDRQECREAAPGFDLSYLMREYSSAVNEGKRERPDKPARAFVGWCRVFYKNNKGKL